MGSESYPLVPSGGLSAPVALTSLATQAAGTLVGVPVGGGTVAPSALTAAQVLSVLGTGTVAPAVVATQAGVVSTATQMAITDAIRQNTEGAELLTASFTPKFSTSTILIFLSGFFTHTAIGTVSSAIFVDATADCEWQGVAGTIPAANYLVGMSAVAVLSAGSTSARTYKWRFGANSAGTCAACVATPSNDLGGKMKHTMMIVEVLA